MPSRASSVGAPASASRPAAASSVEHSATTGVDTPSLEREAATAATPRPSVARDPTTTGP
ncbi:hypothetical protein [Halobiforma nitratireducens]|uniref:hypothetical protein n=1 Tax=Halobiforma nitratireducens TaxID=130048 RepID=UPI0012691A24|nr:hypothetical protein [Halobiforma nitratireducens]